MACTIRSYNDASGNPSALFASLKLRFGEAKALELTLKAEQEGYDITDSDIDKFIEKYNLYQVKPPLTQKQLIDNIKAKEDLIEKKSSSEGYVLKSNGKPVTRVTEYIKRDTYSNRDYLDATQKDNPAASMGTANHQIFEYALNKLIHAKKGVIKNYSEYGITKNGADYVVNVEGKDIQISPSAFSQIMAEAKNLYDEIISIDPNAEILTEVKLFNEEKQLAGTADVVVIHSDGSSYAGGVSIYDLKSKKDKDMFRESPIGYTDREYYDKQLEEYYGALHDAGATRLVQSRVIPIIFQTSGNDKISNIVSSSKNSKIARRLVTPLEKDSVPQNENINELLKNITKIIYLRAEAYAKKKKSQNRDYKMEASEIRYIMDSVLAEQSLDQMFDLFNKEMQEDLNLVAFELYNDPNISSEELYRIINQIRDRVALKEQILDVLRKGYNKVNIAGNTINVNELFVSKYLDKIEKLESKIKNLHGRLDVQDSVQMTRDAVEKGVRPIFGNFRKVSGWTKNLLSFSDIDIPMFNLLMRKVADAEATVQMKTNESYERMNKFKKYLDEVSKEKGVTVTWENFIKNDKLVSKAKAEFWETRKLMFDKLKKDINDPDAKAWFTTNVTFNQAAYDLAYSEKEKLVDAQIAEKTRKGHFNKNPNGQQNYKESIMNEWKKQYNVLDENGNYNGYAYFQGIGYKDTSILTPTDTNDSAEYQFIKSDPRLLEIYNHFLEVSFRAAAISGDRFKYNDIPQVGKNKINLLFEDFSMRRLAGILDVSGVSDREDSIKINPETGESVYTIPLAFVKEIENKKELSHDLGKTFFLLEASLINNEEKQKIEALSLSIKHHASKLKSVRLTKGANRNVIVQNISDAEKALLDKYINYTIYGVKTEEGSKILDNITTYTAMSALGLNILSSVSNLVGGVANMYIIGEKTGLFNKSDIVKAEWDIASGNKKTTMLLDLLGLGRGRNIYSKSNKLAEGINYDMHSSLFVLQEQGDKLVTGTITLAMLNSHTIKEEQKVDRKGDVYYDRKVVLKEVGDKSIVELIDDEGVLDLPSKENIKNIINQLGAFRSKIGKTSAYINGQIIDSADMVNYQGQIWAKVVLQFRGWIFQMGKTRFSETAYDASLDQYTTGRYVSTLNYILGGKKEDSYGKYVGRIPELTKNIVSFAGRILYIDKLFKGSQNNLVEIFRKEYQIYKGLQEKMELEVDLTEDQYIKNNIQNLQSTLTELRFLLVFLMFMGFLFKGSDDDDIGIIENVYLSNLFRRIFMELAFFVDISSATNLTGRNVVPLLSTITTVLGAISNTIMEGAGTVMGNEQIKKESKPMTYFNRLVPMLREFENIYYDLFGNEEEN